MLHTDKKEQESIRIERRHFLQLSTAGLIGAGLLGLSPFTPVAAKPTNTTAEIVILGAGAAGISLANRLARKTKGASITIIDDRERHLYQPGLTLVATGIWRTSAMLDQNSRYMPKGVNWLKSVVQSVDPEQNQVLLAGRKRINYDYLLIATGLELNFAAIEGMSSDLIGHHGIGCVYDNPENAEGTWKAIDRFAQSGGVGIFTRPSGAIKCAGAPLKVAMLTEHLLRQRKTRESAEFFYTAPGTGLFSQPDVDSFLKRSFPERGIDIHWNQRLTSIEPERKRATFATEDGLIQKEYDFIHVVPPMQAVEPIRESNLSWQNGPFSGWLEVDRHTLQHKRYTNVFGAGDCVGTPIGKTAASVKAQVPVVVHNLLRVINNETPDAHYNGYTSCPLITERGQAMLVEFDYDLNMVPSFGFIDPLKEQWVPWIMKDKMLRGAYNAMLRGRV